jgi:hypothetical protein
MNLSPWFFQGCGFWWKMMFFLEGKMMFSYGVKQPCMVQAACLVAVFGILQGKQDM